MDVVRAGQAGALGLLALLALSTLMACGPGMSSGAYRDLSRRVDRENLARFDKAKARLSEEGYVFFKGREPVLFDRDLSRRCFDETKGPPEETTLVRWNNKHAHGRLSEVCSFRFRRAQVLPVTFASGEVVYLTRVKEFMQPARDPQGHMVLVIGKKEVTSERSVLVRSDRRRPYMPSDLDFDEEHPTVAELPESPRVLEVTVKVSVVRAVYRS